MTAVGVIVDSYCQHEHRFSSRVNDRECTLGCVKGGAEFVLVTDTQIYRISDQQRPELQTWQTGVSRSRARLMATGSSSPD